MFVNYRTLCKAIVYDGPMIHVHSHKVVHVCTLYCISLKQALLLIGHVVIWLCDHEYGMQTFKGKCEIYTFLQSYITLYLKSLYLESLLFGELGTCVSVFQVISL